MKGCGRIILHDHLVFNARLLSEENYIWSFFYELDSCETMGYKVPQMRSCVQYRMRLKKGAKIR